MARGYDVMTSVYGLFKIFGTFIDLNIIITYALEIQRVNECLIISTFM
jgi:hypothetical protein